jgi:hypothetical protein
MVLSLLMILRRRDSTPGPACWLAYTPSYTTARKYPRKVSEKTSTRTVVHVVVLAVITYGPNLSIGMLCAEA